MGKRVGSWEHILMSVVGDGQKFALFVCLFRFIHTVWLTVLIITVDTRGQIDLFKHMPIVPRTDIKWVEFIKFSSASLSLFDSSLYVDMLK